MWRCVSQSISSDSLRTQRALRCNFLAIPVSAGVLGHKIQGCDWKIEDRTWQALTENVDEASPCRPFSSYAKVYRPLLLDNFKEPS